MMAETESENGDKIWKKFLRKHWKMLVLFVVGAILASIGAILVFLWFVGDAQLTGLAALAFHAKHWQRDPDNG